MGTIVVQDTIDKTRADLVDADAVTWSDADLIEDYNEALRAFAQIKPDSCQVTGAIPLVAGTVQTLPANGTIVFDVFQNEVSERRITQVDEELLDETARFWPAGNRTIDVRHFCYDPRNKNQFRCWPPNNGEGSVLASYGTVPGPVAYLDVLPIGDQWEPAIYTYILGAAYRRNTQRQDLTKATAYMGRFAQMLGLGAAAEGVTSPKVSQSPGE